MKKRFLWPSFRLLCLLGILVLFLVPLVHAATTTTVVVTAADLATTAIGGQNKWFMYNDTTDTIDNTLGTFVQGPGTPPYGKGSIQFILGASPLDRKNIATYQFRGLTLASITQMAFSVYSHGGTGGAGPTESPFLNFNIDLNGSNSFQGRLVYVPSANGAVPQNAWNTFDAINSGNAKWTWSHFSGTWPDGNTNQYRTWNEIKTAFPTARVLPSDGWLGIRVGEPGPTGYTANVNSFTLGTANGTTTFNFEPGVTAQPITATEGIAFSGQEVASGYVTAGFAPPFSATINWGDGTPMSIGTVIVNCGIFTVNGSHTYAEEGSQTFTVTVKDANGDSISSSNIATIGDAPLTLNTLLVYGSVGHTGILSQARFSDANTHSTAADFTATINWGDSTTSTATVTSLGFGQYLVGYATHTYASSGHYSVTLTIKDIGGSIASGSQNINVF